MSKFDDKMSEIFDVPAVTITPITPTITTSTEVSSKKDMTSTLDFDLMDDYVTSRDNLKDIISKGSLAIDDILAIARESEHPRAFEVAATMIKNVTEANEKLLVLQKQMRELTGTQKQSSLNVNKAAIFIGSTSELSKMLKNEMKVIEDGNS